MDEKIRVIKLLWKISYQSIDIRGHFELSKSERKRGYLTGMHDLSKRRNLN